MKTAAMSPFAHHPTFVAAGFQSGRCTVAF